MVLWTTDEIFWPKLWLEVKTSLTAANSLLQNLNVLADGVIETFRLSENNSSNQDPAQLQRPFCSCADQNVAKQTK